MPLPIVSPADLKARYPAFAGVDEALITLVLADASGAVDDTWIAGDQKSAILAYAAHLLSVEGYGGQTVTVGSEDLDVTGAVEMVKIGDSTVKFASVASGAAGGAAGSASDLKSTSYGRRYLELLRRSNPAVTVV